VHKHPYETLWGNSRFAEDLRLMHEICNFETVFCEKKKGKEKTYKFDIDKKSGYPYFIEMMVQRFIEYMGVVRRNEIGCGEKLSHFTLDIYTGFLSDPNMQTHFIHLSGMSVPGYIDNYLKAYVYNEMAQHINKVLDREALKTYKAWDGIRVKGL
jgi:hypothetical protein